MPTLAADHIDMLRNAVRGKVLLPQDAGYDVARTVWNATVDRRPAVIVQCTGTADVMQAVNFARDRGLTVAVRGGGHNIAGSAICNDGLVVDLSGLRSVHVDPHDNVAWVSPGATLGDFDHEAQALGLATPTAIMVGTGRGAQLRIEAPALRDGTGHLRVVGAVATALHLGDRPMAQIGLGQRDPVARGLQLEHHHRHRAVAQQPEGQRQIGRHASVSPRQPGQHARTIQAMLPEPGP